MIQKKKALGRGLDALLDLDDIQTEGSSSIQEIPIASITVNKDQPRKEFSKDALEELAESIRQIGIIQPVTLREVSKGQYQIIAGERRFRASQMAGKQTIPAYVRTADDENVMEMALIENIQREDLNAIEIALAYQNLMDQYDLTQEKLSQRVGKKRTTIANYLRLLKLPAAIQMALQEKKIDMGHARALISLADPTLQVALLDGILENGWSVRQVEEQVRQYEGGSEEDKNPEEDASEAQGQETKKPASKAQTPGAFQELENHLQRLFGTKVTLNVGKRGKGKVCIPFKNEEELTNLMLMLDTIKKTE